jgi:PEP-CTERM motif-containing protein
MLKRFLQCGSIAVATILLAAPARAATVIDFATNGAGMGGWLTWNGGNVTGANIPIGAVTIASAPTGNGSYAVFGTAVGTGTHEPGGSHLFGDLDFATGPGSFISLAGCIPGLSIGRLDAAGNCVNPVMLLTGTIASFDSSNASHGLISATGPDTKSPTLLAALGLPANAPFQFFGFSIATNALGPDVGSSAISTDIANTQVPEPASLLLLGTGLLALFRTRRGAA